MLFQLACDARVRVYMHVEDAELCISEGNRGGESEARTPRALLPRQSDALHVGERQAAQNRQTRVALFTHAYALFKVEPPLSVFGLNIRRRRDMHTRVLEAESFG